MLIRVILENIFSFAQTTEFNMLSAPRYADHKSHKKIFNNIDILKFSAIYGANGAGKSNLVKSVSLFRKLFNNKIDLSEIIDRRNKLTDELERQLFALEFICNDQRYIYAIEIKEKIVSNEEIYRILKNDKQELLYKRETNIKTFESKIDCMLFDITNEKDKLMIEFFLENMFNPHECSILSFSNLKHENLTELKNIVQWFNQMIIIEPHSRIPHIPYVLNKNSELYDYFNNSMHAFNVGIDSVELIKEDLSEVLDDKKQVKEIKIALDKSENKLLIMRGENEERVTISKEDKEYYAYALHTIHKLGEEKIPFSFGEESDGTKRLFDLLSAFNSIVNEEKVILIDEVERSIHPVLIKTVLEKLTLNESVKGQFIFTTHESNLLDLSLLRRDEIWFTEKNLNGSTEFYPLSDFHEHKTKDVRKGYLQGRYGAIPFIGNLDDLNWGI